MFKFLKRFKRLLPSLKKAPPEDNVYTRTVKKIDFDGFQKAIHYTIVKKEYFITALTHRSFVNIKKEHLKAGLISNERLEFLGDAVLDLVVAEYLYKNFPMNEEGDLTKFRSILVNKRFLAERAKNINLQEYILASFTAIKSIQEGYDAILADAYEAIIGAIFLDSGYEAAQEFLKEEIFVKLDIKWLDEFDENHKSKFLEYSQANTEYVPEYTVIKEEGPEHNKMFTVEVYLNTTSLGVGQGRSKKQAEQMAAKNAMENLDRIEPYLKKKKQK